MATFARQCPAIAGQGGQEDSTIAFVDACTADELCLLVGVDGTFVTHRLPEDGELTIGRGERNAI